MRAVLKLLRFKAKGFRSLNETDWIPINKLTVFTGQNDGGKSSVLEAIAIFLDPKKIPDADDYTKDAAGNVVGQVTLAGEFLINDEERKTLGLHSLAVSIRRDYSATQPQSYLYETAVHPDERLRRDLSGVRNDELLQLADEFAIQLSNRRQKESIVREMNQWLQTQQLQPGWLGLPHSMTVGFPEFKLFQSSDALDPEEQINDALKSSFVTRIRSDTYSGVLSGVSSQIEREMLRDLDIFLPILRVYCPDVTSINIRPTFDFSNGFRTSKLLLTQSSGSEIDLTKLGQGRSRRITLAVYEWTEQLITQQEGPTPFEQTLVAFDEPDTHLDYTQQRKIFDIIKRISSKDDTNVIVCTHSLNLIDRIPITDIVHFRLEGGITRTSVITTDDPDLTDLFLYQISETMGLRNSAILNERCFLVVEGPTEVWSLPVLFKLKFGYLPQAAGIKILDGESGIGARLFAKFLSNNLGRNVIFLVDTDTTLSPHQRHFTREALIEDGYNLETQVHFVGAKEYEDAFTDETYLRAANTFWPKADGSEWNISEFQRLRGEDDFCDELMALIRRQTRSNVSKPKVGKQVAQSLGRLEDIPSEIDRCLQHAHDLANRD